MTMLQEAMHGIINGRSSHAPEELPAPGVRGWWKQGMVALLVVLVLLFLGISARVSLALINLPPVALADHHEMQVDHTQP